MNHFLSFFYAIARFSLGLLIHPYQTMQLIVSEKIFIWLSLLPSLGLAVVTLAWRVLLLALGGIVASWLSFEATLLVKLVLDFLATWLIWFCVYWQVLLFYLLLRFSLASKNLT